jgi:hypothetical protein
VLPEPHVPDGGDRQDSDIVPRPFGISLLRTRVGRYVRASSSLAICSRKASTPSADLPGSVIGLPCSVRFPTGRGGLLQLLSASLSSCRRYHPAGARAALEPVCDLSCCLRFPVTSSASGVTHSGGLCVHSRCGPTTRRDPEDGVVNGLQGIGVPSSLPSKLRGLWLLPRRDCLPLHAPAVAGHTSGLAVFPHPAFGLVSRLHPSPLARQARDA